MILESYQNPITTTAICTTSTICISGIALLLVCGRHLFLKPRKYQIDLHLNLPFEVMGRNRDRKRAREHQGQVWIQFESVGHGVPFWHNAVTYANCWEKPEDADAVRMATSTEQSCYEEFDRLTTKTDFKLLYDAEKSVHAASSEPNAKKVTTGNQECDRPPQESGKPGSWVFRPYGILSKGYWYNQSVGIVSGKPPLGD
jgi:hypothetical protein